MTITEKEIREDFERFIRHEAMRANITQAELKEILGLTIKKVKVMENQTRIERDIDREEIKRIWQQLAIGTALALAGLVFMGIGELVCRWIEGQ
jgi:hypothetical protein